MLKCDSWPEYSKNKNNDTNVKDNKHSGSEQMAWVWYVVGAYVFHVAIDSLTSFQAFTSPSTSCNDCTNCKCCNQVQLYSSHHITSHHITSHHITSHHITSHHTMSHSLDTYLLITGSGCGKVSLGSCQHAKIAHRNALSKERLHLYGNTERALLVLGGSGELALYTVTQTQVHIGHELSSRVCDVGVLLVELDGFVYMCKTFLGCFETV
jgi:hypothetical protein